MNLTEHQMTVVVQKVTELVVEHYSEMSKIEKFTARSQVKDLIIPALQELPKGVTEGNLIDHIDSLRRAAINILISKMRAVQAYRNAPDADIIRNISPNHLEEFVKQIYAFTRVALEVLPPEESLETIVNSFDSLDLDAELHKLLDDDGEGFAGV